MAKKLPPIPKGTEVTDAITKHMDRRFLSSLDLIGQGKLTLTIDRVEKLAELTYGTGRTDTNVKLVYFAGTDKPLKLCVENIRRIIQLFGTGKVSEWKGKKVTFHIETVKVKGKDTPAVRVVEKK